MKYIIEIEDKPNADGAYKAVGFGTLYFSKGGLKRLEPYREQSIPIPSAGIKRGSPYWFISSEGEPCEAVWDDNFIDNDRWAFDNVFMSLESALVEKRRRLLMKKLEMLSHEVTK